MSADLPPSGTSDGAFGSPSTDPPADDPATAAPATGDDTPSSNQHGVVTRRRVLLGVGAAAGLGAGAWAARGLAGTAATPRRRPRRPSTTTTRPAAVTMTALASGVEIPVAAWVVAENLRPGTLDWLVSRVAGARVIEGFADTVSAAAGDDVVVFATTPAASFHVEAYRMGWYQGTGARLVWRSATAPGMVQPAATVAPDTAMVACRWVPSTVVPVTDSWPPGSYLLKLVAADGGQGFVPLCVRDDTSSAAFVIQSSVTTWQAYNRWGGHSLYVGPGNASATRARVVSFDRPYQYGWAWGAADFIGNELPLIQLAEHLGLDVSYSTDVDLHLRGELLLRHRTLISLGHDEYWSQAMRTAATTARDQGVNLAFLGANACYRHVRLQPAPTGPARQQVCYKTDFEHQDPLWGVDPAEVTANWPDGPVPRPEQELIGASYADIDANADLVVADPTAWVLVGTGLAAGAHIPGFYQGEYDHFTPALGPTNADVVAHSPVANRGPGAFADMTYYTAPSGAGVFDTGSAAFVNTLYQGSSVPPAVIRTSGQVAATAPLLGRMVENIFSVFGAGPAGLTHPSSGTWRKVY